jgi:hypothetical protein
MRSRDPRPEQQLAERRLDAQQHLELVPLAGGVEPLGQPPHLVDQPLVVRGRGRRPPPSSSVSQSSDERPADQLRVGVGAAVGLDVDALADADVRRSPSRTSRRASASERRSMACSTTPVRVIPSAREASVQVERRVRRRRVLHVDPHEAPVRPPR